MRASRALPFLAAACPRQRSLTSITSTLPPAFSTASIAPFDAPATLKLTLVVSSPLPSRRTPSLPPRARPAAFSAAWSSVPLASSLPGVDHLLDRAQVHLGIILGEDVVEAALRQPHVERHLAALEALDRDARAALLALLAAAGGLALARADAASDAHAALAGAGIVAEFVDLDGHVLHSLSLLSRMRPDGEAARPPRLV